MFAGLDRDVYPGAETMAALKAKTNLEWTGFYLAPTSNHSDESWMTAYAALRAQGWGLAPTYLGREEGSPNLNAAHGETDAANAVELAVKAGFPKATVIYLDLESGSQPDEGMKLYVTAFCAAVTKAGATPGIYCSHVIAPAIAELSNFARLWIYRVPADPATPVSQPYSVKSPAGSGVKFARMWQYVHAVDLEVSGEILLRNVDLNSSVLRDPSVP